jgi:hypothetical protein
VKGIAKNAQLMMDLYPDWVMRVYHDIIDGSMNSTLDSLQSRFGHVLDFCFVGNLPGYGNVRGDFILHTHQVG